MHLAQMPLLRQVKTQISCDKWVEADRLEWQCSSLPPQAKDQYKHPDHCVCICVLGSPALPVSSSAAGEWSHIVLKTLQVLLEISLLANQFASRYGERKCHNIPTFSPNQGKAHIFKLARPP